MEIQLHTDFEPYYEIHEIAGEGSLVYNQWIFRFGDKGLSVVCHTCKDMIITYGNEECPFEAVLVEIDNDGNKELIAEPNGYFTEEDINKMLHKLEEEDKCCS
jgi:hypothetical protein|uniref:Uncharacterized protein n=1 Tax=Myoviridae sp. ct78050 TaxID=2826617 RepID=A0A8S5R266_9CAUD|nr:MAG TPA: hypothetical protein [Myoviridae sp. ct78050]